ncbi:hypothetical protein GDO81_028163 [Engystomops pustulosus]|uniref:Secreted protein n=1 Tax=Engystomops pustulosus TaxID=76066 RepID=A0AAV6ZLS4_ENGPU|nr:hypothetical protein GDO81_028163 [Engystomops pustulosus]KAG8550131.1 hypothetical protein GDO81_028163 [Engystomops pustulosus]KAG8550132.1 hypothetical protein GDO81_028163 [Engystomops pustulosus]
MHLCKSLVTHVFALNGVQFTHCLSRYILCFPAFTRCCAIPLRQIHVITDHVTGYHVTHHTTTWLRPHT